MAHEICHHIKDRSHKQLCPISGNKSAIEKFADQCASAFLMPKHIRDMMVRLLAPTPDDRICDPACGTAGFLVSSAEYIREKYESEMTAEQWERFAGDTFTGFDTDRTMLRLSAMNLMLHSISNPHINYADSVSKQNEIWERF